MPVSPAFLHSPSVLLSFSSLKSGWVSGGKEGGSPKPEEFSECPECWLTQPAGVSHLSQLWWGSASIRKAAGCAAPLLILRPESPLGGGSSRGDPTRLGATEPGVTGVHVRACGGWVTAAALLRWVVMGKAPTACGKAPTVRAGLLHCMVMCPSA